MWSVDRQPGYFVSFGAYQIYDTILNNMEIQAAENRWSCARFQKQINAGFCFSHAAIIKKVKNCPIPNKLAVFPASLDVGDYRLNSRPQHEAFFNGIVEAVSEHSDETELIIKFKQKIRKC